MYQDHCKLNLNMDLCKLLYIVFIQLSIIKQLCCLFELNTQKNYILKFKTYEIEVY